MAKRKQKRCIEVQPDGSWIVSINLDWKSINKSKPKRREKPAPKDPPPPPEDPDQLRLFDEKGGES